MNIKKIGFWLGMVCCVVFLGNTITGWVKNKKDDTKDDNASTNQTAVVQTVAE